MTFIRTTQPDDAAEGTLAMYQRQQESWGYVPNYARLFSHRPEVMAKWAHLLACLKRNAGVRRFELVTFAAARALDSSYCTLAHFRALAKLLTATELEFLVHETGPDPFAPAEREMMRFATKVVRGAARISAGDVQALHAHGLSDAEIFDIAATAAGRAFFANLIEALGAEADSTFLDLPEDVRQVLTVGRPIDFRVVVRLPDVEQKQTAQR
jgi:uncharacterized peroxidase-related enzyme